MQSMPADIHLERQRRSDPRRGSANLSTPLRVATVTLTSHRGAMDRWNPHMLEAGNPNAKPNLATRSQRRANKGTCFFCIMRGSSGCASAGSVVQGRVIVENLLLSPFLITMG
ncbi:hypothetical protein UPYG_G00082720 [Umbra pygmaea]|uniref:Uncharacterized protein n=1 Tax=Umbra pygmaea TaxID=75934 RepID=A0ABD0XYH8_UMBPY